jgi:hypothetical protein
MAKIKLTDKEAADMRFKCIELVINNGSKLDARSPFEKAETFFSFIMGEVIETAKEVSDKDIEAPVVPVAQAETVMPKVQSASIEKNPFTDSGRPKVLIS